MVLISVKMRSLSHERKSGLLTKWSKAQEELMLLLLLLVMVAVVVQRLKRGCSLEG